MTKKTAPIVEMVAAMLGVFALTDCDSFGWRHMIIGSTLALYVFQGVKRYKTLYESVLYCAVASLVVLLTLGKPLDWLRDNHFRESVSRDGALALAWGTSFVILFIVHHKTSTERS